MSTSLAEAPTPDTLVSGLLNGIPAAAPGAVPFIPENSPFSPAQRFWLNGYLAGLTSDANPGSASTAFSPIAAPPRLKVLVLFGSQTGTAEALAKKVRKRLSPKHPDLEFRELNAQPIDQLAKADAILILASTYGDGEPPDNAALFYAALHADTAPRLDGIHFHVLGLGDRSYPEFNACAVKIDARMADLGAIRCAPAVLADVDYDADFETWLTTCEGHLAKVAGAASAPSSNTTVIVNEPEDEPASPYDKRNPYEARIAVNLNLNGSGSAKETRHIEIDLGESGLRYKAGDALGVKPLNNARLVDELIAAAGFQPHELAPLPTKTDGPLFDALREHYDITALTPSFVQACARLSKSSELQRILADPEAMKAYLDGRQMIDPILEFGIVFPTTEYLIAPLRQLQARLYSISSGPSAHPGRVHLTVGAVRYESHGRRRAGVCSGYLADLGKGASVKVYPHANPSFALPADPEAPLIMVGPGTGIAPFRAFLEERRARGHCGRNWLFFGDQHEATDYLYHDQLAGFLADGTLTRIDTAFSRDGQEKAYVQNRMWEQAEELFAWLENGAVFCVCGDASRMAKDVDAMLHRIIATQSGGGDDKALDYMADLKAKKRYLRDVY